ncbi:MAG TPA: hypothetical protein VKQ52_15340 [Puia sp.]|nr:hypothetical protein [Puia sp.]
MYDPKFEKGVQQKMEGLQFIPSESVWANIEKAVANRRRRRTAFYFWRVAIPAGIMLAGATALLYHPSRPVAGLSPATKPFPAAPSAATPVTASNGATTKTMTPASTAHQPATAFEAATAHTVTPASILPSTASTAAPTRSARSHLRSSHPGTPATGGTTPTEPAENATTNRTSAGKTPATTDITAISATGKTAHTANTPATGNTAADANTPAGTNTPGLANTTRTRFSYRPTLAGLRHASSIQAAKLSTKRTIIGLSAIQKTQRPWEAGFVGGGGISRLNRLNVTQPMSSAAASFVNITTAAYTATAGTNKNYVSDVRPGASFLAGIYLQKAFSSRWTINLGMNLHYYSTMISVGEPVSTYVPLTVSLIAPTAQASSQATTAYTAGNRNVVTNRYYFMELPVNIQYTLNKSRILPLFLQGGFSLSRLMASDALFYNSHSGVYYRDASVLQKTQFNVSSALMAGLPFHGIRIQVGPEIQYGLTPLINNKSLGDQHFLYTGIRLVVIPGRR